MVELFYLYLMCPTKWLTYGVLHQQHWRSQGGTWVRVLHPIVAEISICLRLLTADIVMM